MSDKIEISSSNFHLQRDGNLVIGGGAKISASLSANSILTVPDLPKAKSATENKYGLNSSTLLAGITLTTTPEAFKAFDVSIFFIFALA